ncbi:NUDIX hydrolase [Yoonia litorea]|nr:NUDIX hydrolase [Yoonia litorea]
MAALCYRGQGTRREYLLVTSRDTGRWIIPKGWPMRGLSSDETALREAWEEAGVKRGKAAPEPIGHYTYDKMRDSGLAVPVEALVYSVEVKELAEEFPEADQRKRKWVSADEAAEMVRESELKLLFLEQATDDKTD